MNTRCYRILLWFLFRLDPERSHALAFALIRRTTALPILRPLLTRLFTYPDPILKSQVMGLEFASPLGLAAGFDKNATAAHAWAALGFGYAEIGTLTPRPQPGNPPPRLFRLPTDSALINRMGFNNIGVQQAVTHLRHTPKTIPLGANIGKNKTTPPENAPHDYATSAHTLTPHADFLVVNVSSPNTPGLRDLQTVDVLRRILTAVLQATTLPVLVKISPDLTDTDIDAIADLAVEMGLAGIVATNTTIDRPPSHTSRERLAEIGAGGLSGPPLADRSLCILRRLYQRVGTRLVLVSVGGITTPDDAYQRIRAGASLLQGYTGFIYAGPFWARRIHRGLAKRLRADGYHNLTEAIGTDNHR